MLLMKNKITLHEIFMLTTNEDIKKRNKKLKTIMEIHLRNLLDKRINVFYERNGNPVIKRAIK